MFGCSQKSEQFKFTETKNSRVEIEFGAEKIADLNIISHSYTVHLYSQGRTVAVVTVKRDERGVRLIDLIEWENLVTPKVTRLYSESKE